MSASDEIKALALNEESAGVGWWPLDALPELHPGFSASLPVLRPLLV